MPRRTSLALLSPMVMIAACGGDDSSPNPAPAPPPAQVTLETFNTNLAGASFSKYESERRQPIVEAIAKLPSDVVCLQEVWRQSDKDLIAAAAKGLFPYALSVRHTLDTPVDDPEDQSGQTPPVPEQALCAAPDLAEKLVTVLDCMAQNCSSVPGSDQGLTTSTECAVQQCTSAAVALLFGDDAERKCYGCAAALLPTETIAGIREQCTTDPRAGLAFHGQNGLLLLSRHPLEETGAWVLPGTWNRRAVLRAKARLPVGEPVQVFCTHLTEVYNLPAFPYTGLYGEGESGAKGWAKEQALQAQKLIAHVTAVAGSGSKAVVLGGFGAGPEVSELAVQAVGAEAWTLLSERFLEAVTASYTPACTFCTNGENPLAVRATSSWVDHVLMQGFKASQVSESARSLTEGVVTPPETDGGTSSDSGPVRVPLSDHYGMRSTLRLDP